MKKDLDCFLGFNKTIVLLCVLVIDSFLGFSQNSADLNSFHFSIEDESIFRSNANANMGLNIFRFNIQTPTSSPIPLQIGFDYVNEIYPNVNGRFTNFRFNLNTEKYHNEVTKLRQKEESYLKLTNSHGESIDGLKKNANDIKERELTSLIDNIKGRKDSIVDLIDSLSCLNDLQPKLSTDLDTSFKDSINYQFYRDSINNRISILNSNLKSFTDSIDNVTEKIKTLQEKQSTLQKLSEKKWFEKGLFKDINSISIGQVTPNSTLLTIQEFRLNGLGTIYESSKIYIELAVGKNRITQPVSLLGNEIQIPDLQINNYKIDNVYTRFGYGSINKGNFLHFGLLKSFDQPESTIRYSRGNIFLIGSKKFKKQSFVTEIATNINDNSTQSRNILKNNSNISLAHDFQANNGITVNNKFNFVNTDFSSIANPFLISNQLNLSSNLFIPIKNFNISINPFYAKPITSTQNELIFNNLVFIEYQPAISFKIKFSNVTNFQSNINSEYESYWNSLGFEVNRRYKKAKIQHGLFLKNRTNILNIAEFTRNNSSWSLLLKELVQVNKFIVTYINELEFARDADFGIGLQTHQFEILYQLNKINLGTSASISRNNDFENFVFSTFLRIEYKFNSNTYIGVNYNAFGKWYENVGGQQINLRFKIFT